ncbi:DNA-binding NarL/FixJ family response regulator [Clavibacter michiganensis]|uniref:response regulator n=1 Tax=Clavibacter michiganensis TaxID=28447 RepID=UPI001AE62B69|nr:response regulator transcription factor [Clavibacter michiganensis]MBP2458392.1 DNA-binding NarL/FixJ family response regulator [Clavibacter michiganensis]MDQ0410963.1 DNA-binding NarL/FixJ family response regulator [Clavibacter michiganensis]
MITVFLVDDHEIVRQGIAALVDGQPDLELVGEADTVARALARIAATRPDVAVLDVRLPDGSGITLCREIRSTMPEVRCLMLTAYDDDAASYAAVLAGAAGYVLKDIRGHGLLDGIRRVAAGQQLGDPRTARRVVDAIRDISPDRAADPSLASLTPRERAVLDLIAEGMSNRQIGEVLDIAEKTVKNYVSGLLRKLGMERRTQAAIYGLEHRPPR